METLQMFILIFQALLTVVVVLCGFIIKGLVERVKTLEGDVKSMKENYLTRFMDVIKNQNDVKEDLMREHSTTKEDLMKQQNIMKEELLSAISQIRIDIASGHVCGKI